VPFKFRLAIQISPVLCLVGSSSQIQLRFYRSQTVCLVIFLWLVFILFSVFKILYALTQSNHVWMKLTTPNGYHYKFHIFLYKRISNMAKSFYATEQANPSIICHLHVVLAISEVIFISQANCQWGYYLSGSNLFPSVIRLTYELQRPSRSGRVHALNISSHLPVFCFAPWASFTIILHWFFFVAFVLFLIFIFSKDIHIHNFLVCGCFSSQSTLWL
jgi:hypothetical protein